MNGPKQISISSSGDVVEDVYNAFSFSLSSLANRRPIWTVHFIVDQFGFFIGGLGGIGMGYLLEQYEPYHLNNDNYVNQGHTETTNFFFDLVKHVISNPLQIAQRFFLAGGLYVFIGLLTSRMLKADSWSRPFACGALTGLYFSYGSTLSQQLKATATFAGFALLMEGLFSLAMR